MSHDSPARATRIRAFDFNSIPMRAFHMSWMAFLVSFFAWFGIAPLMPVVRAELGLTDAEVGWCIVGSVGTTVFARLFVGWLCDRVGPRRAYAAVLVAGSVPVMAIGLAGSFASFLALRMMIGFVGAAFVVTQVHTSRMFAPRCVGTANALAAGFGNAGGGLANMGMPLVFTFLAGSLGLGPALGWRVAMLGTGVVVLAFGVAYFLLTQDSPDGERFEPVRERAGDATGGFLAAARDVRVLALAGIYAASFGVELTVHNVAALYFVDRFGADLTTAGVAAGTFGVLAVVARAAGGRLSDGVAARFGLRGRTVLLGAALLAEGAALVLFSAAPDLGRALPALLLFGVFVHVACGSTFAVVPFVRPGALGAVTGLVGAGGNLGAVFAGLLFGGGMPWSSAFQSIGLLVIGASALALLVRFSPAAERSAAGEDGLVATPRAA